jgi:hypothetical protein
VRRCSVKKLKQIVVVRHNVSGVDEIVGLREDGVLFRGQVSIEQGGGKVKVFWTEMEEEVRK